MPQDIPFPNECAHGTVGHHTLLFSASQLHIDQNRNSKFPGVSSVTTTNKVTSTSVGLSNVLPRKRFCTFRNRVHKRIFFSCHHRRCPIPPTSCFHPSSNLPIFEEKITRFKVEVYYEVEKYILRLDHDVPSLKFCHFHVNESTQQICPSILNEKKTLSGGQNMFLFLSFGRDILFFFIFWHWNNWNRKIIKISGKDDKNISYTLKEPFLFPICFFLIFYFLFPSFHIFFTSISIFFHFLLVFFCLYFSFFLSFWIFKFLCVQWCILLIHWSIDRKLFRSSSINSRTSSNEQRIVAERALFRHPPSPINWYHVQNSFAV